MTGSAGIGPLPGSRAQNESDDYRNIRIDVWVDFFTSGLA